MQNNEMRIRQLIEQLESIAKEHGDDVLVNWDEQTIKAQEVKISQVRVFTRELAHSIVDLGRGDMDSMRTCIWCKCSPMPGREHCEKCFVFGLCDTCDPGFLGHYSRFKREPMNVEKLIARLQKCDPAAKVTIWNQDERSWLSEIFIDELCTSYNEKEVRLGSHIYDMTERKENGLK